MCVCLQACQLPSGSLSFLQDCWEIDMKPSLTVHSGHSPLYLFFPSSPQAGRKPERGDSRLLDSWDNALSVVPQTHVFRVSLSSPSPPTCLPFPGVVPVLSPLSLSGQYRGALEPPREILGRFLALTSIWSRALGRLSKQLCLYSQF